MSCLYQVHFLDGNNSELTLLSAEQTGLSNSAQHCIRCGSVKTCRMTAGAKWRIHGISVPLACMVSCKKGAQGESTGRCSRERSQERVPVI